MKYIVDITDAALEDMDAICEYILYRFKTLDTAAAQYDCIADEILCSMTVLQTKYFLWRKCRCVMEFRNLSHALRHSSIGCS